MPHLAPHRERRMFQRSNRMRVRGVFGPFVGKGIVLHGQGLSQHGGQMLASGLYLHGEGVFDGIKRFFSGPAKSVAKSLFRSGAKHGKKIFLDSVLPYAKDQARGKIDSGISSLNSKFTEKTGVKGLSDDSLKLVKGKTDELLDRGSKKVFGAGIDAGPVHLNNAQIKHQLRVAQENIESPYSLPKKTIMDRHTSNILDGIIIASKLKKKQKKRMLAGKGLITM